MVEELRQASEAINERAGLVLVVWSGCDTCDGLYPKRTDDTGAVHGMSGRG